MKPLEKPIHTSLGDQLIEACYKDDLNAAEALLKEGAPITYTNSGGRTPLIVAAARGNCGLVRLLIEKGAPVDEKKDEYNALMYAAGRGYITVARLLVEHGATFPHDTDTGRIVLQIAALYGRQEMVDLLQKVPTLQQKEEAFRQKIHDSTKLQRDLPSPPFRFKRK